MTDKLDDGQSSRPLLLRFLRPTPRAAVPYRYDRSRRVNIVEGKDVPAVRGGADLKTFPPGPGED